MAGVRHVWALDRPELAVLSAYNAVLVTTTVILGSPWIAAGMVFALTLTWAGFTIWRRARSYAESRNFAFYMQKWEDEMMARMYPDGVPDAE